MNKIKILIDSPSDLSLKKAEERDIKVIPVKFSMGDDEELIRDKYDITEDEFYKKIRETGIIPKTVQITPYEFEEAFREFADDYDDLICITLSSASSGTHRNAVLAKEAVESEKDVKIHIVDSKAFSFVYGYLGILAADLVKEGKSAEEIVKILEDKVETSTAFFTVETLEYLKKGGRITTLSAIIGGVLDIRPILKITDDGLVAAFDKVKGEKKVFSKLVEYVKEEALKHKDPVIYLLYSDRKDKTEKMQELLEAEGIKIAGYERVGSIIGSHAGPGVFGITII